MYAVIDDLNRVFGIYRLYRTALRQIIAPDGSYGRQGWRIVEVN